MAQPYKRQRIKTGKNSWINRTVGPNGTRESFSTKFGHTTYNVNPKRGNRMWNNYAGWISRTKTSNAKRKTSRAKKAKTKFSYKTALLLLGVFILYCIFQ